MTTKILNIKSLLVTLAIFLTMSTIAMTPVKALMCPDSDCTVPFPIFKNGLLIVRVKNADGTYAEGANVKVYNLNNDLVDSGTTGKYGGFFAILPKGNYYVVAEKDGLEQRSDDFYLRLLKRILITLPEQPTCTDIDKDGYAIEGGVCGPVDCNDNDASIHPEAVEVCNGIDDNCDGSIDEGLCCESDIVTVIVIDSTENPVAGATVSIWSGSSPIATGTTDDYGVAILETLDPDTLYVAKAETDNLSGTNTFTTNCAGGADVTVNV